MHCTARRRGKAVALVRLRACVRVSVCVAAEWIVSLTLD